jgi:hypothetical protein
VRIHPLNEDNIDLEIDLCLKCHPSGFIPEGPQIGKGRNLKKEFLKEILEKVNPCGFVAEENNKPVALLELMPREYAKRSGYITGSKKLDDETLTITCLEVAYGFNRKEMMRAMVTHLIQRFEEFRPFKRIEVGAFKKDVDFHPSWVYLEAGFKISEDRGEVLVLKKPIP